MFLIPFTFIRFDTIEMRNPRQEAARLCRLSDGTHNDATLAALQKKARAFQTGIFCVFFLSRAKKSILAESNQ